MNDQLRDKIIRMAWEDRTTFEEIEKQTGYPEADVIKVMRAGMKASSFRMWRKRVSGRITKHGRAFNQSRKELKKGTTQQWLNSSD